MLSHYLVFNVLRMPNKDTFEFYLIFGDSKNKFISKISTNMLYSIIRGSVFIGDLIEIFNVHEDCIEFRVLPKASSETFSSILDCKFTHYNNNMKYSYLPFLNDTPTVNYEFALNPFTGLSTYTINECGNRNVPLRGLILYKSRLLSCNSKVPFFFFITIKSGYKSVNILFLEDKVELFATLKPEMSIVITDYKRRKYSNSDCLSINSFSECNLLSNVQLEVLEESNVYINECNIINKTIMHTKYLTHLYENIEGTISVVSPIMRSRNHCEDFLKTHNKILEYLICKIDERVVVIFNNCQSDFNEIRCGKEISLKNLWCVTRGNFKYLTSSIVTEMEVSGDGNTGVENLLCFVPDCYSKLEDLDSPEYNKINRLDVEISKKFKIHKMSIRELFIFKDNLVINEHRKVMIRGFINAYDLKNTPSIYESNESDRFTNDEDKIIRNNITPSLCQINIEYIEDGESKEMEIGTIRIVSDGESLDAVLFRNFLIEDDMISQVFGSDTPFEMNKDYIFILDVFRSSVENVLVCLSRAFKI